MTNEKETRLELGSCRKLIVSLVEAGPKSQKLCCGLKMVPQWVKRFQAEVENLGLIPVLLWPQIKGGSIIIGP